MNLLTQPIIRVRMRDGTARDCTLPEVFAELTRDTIASFEGLQLHQAQAWYSFLVQLAAMSLRREADPTPPDSPAEWEALLIARTSGDEEPWSLVVEDLSRPAFMQPPAEKAERSDYLSKSKRLSLIPDEADVLVTSKNHDVKMSRADTPEPDHWLYVLVTTQTLSGFLGRGNYGIARMNGGFSSRPQVGLVPSSMTWGARLTRDIRVLLDNREAVLAEGPGFASEGIELLWLEPWDGETSLSPPQLDPYVIEVCRRLRMFCLECDGGETRLALSYIPTGAPRIEARDLNGVLADPWVPVSPSRGAALTVSGSGFHYTLMQALLFEQDLKAPTALHFHPDDPEEMFMEARVLVRGQGQTEGFHRRLVPIPKKIRSRFKRPSERERLAMMSQSRVELTGNVRSRVLYPSLRMLLEGGEQRSGPPGDQRHTRWQDDFEAAVDARFFSSLWRDALLDDPEQAALNWQRELYTLALEQYQRAAQSVPFPSMRRYRALSSSRDLFEACAHQQLPAWSASLREASLATEPPLT